MTNNRHGPLHFQAARYGTKSVDWSDRLIYLIVGFGGVGLGLAAILSVWTVIGDVMGWL